MSVYTTITSDELSAFLDAYDIGTLESFAGISDGVTNTIYQFTTTQGKFILTIFEELSADELPFYINLIRFLKQQEIVCPQVIYDKTEHTILDLKNKPAVVMKFLPGKTIIQPAQAQCQAIGKVLGQLHANNHNFPHTQADSRGSSWRTQTAEQLYSVLDVDDRLLLQDEMSYHATHSLDALPRGIIHADLFRDNVLFDDDKLTGVLDFYYACEGAYLYDLAITINDWCLTPKFGIDPQTKQLLITNYQFQRELSSIETDNWPTALRLAALRFWLSRLHDYHFTAPSENIQIKNPNDFRQLLLFHREAHS